jgi:hypothetical protein
MKLGEMHAMGTATCLRLVLVAAMMTALPVLAQKLVKLSPSGEKILAAKYAEYPAFDEAKARADADQVHPVVENGEMVTVLLRGREVKGAFRGMDAKYLRIGDRSIALIDLEPDVIARFSAEENKKLRERFVARERAAYELERDDVLAEFREDVYRKYQPLADAVLKILFDKVPSSRRAALAAAFATLYDARLPMAGDDREFLRQTAQAFLDAHPELVRSGNHFWMKEELAAIEKRMAEIALARALRRQARILQPRTATPIIAPDGGNFQSWIEIVLASTTPGAIIHYTIDGEEPTEASPRYDEPIKLATMATVKAIAFHPEFNDSEIMTAAPWDGGLFGVYFPTMTFKGDAVTRVDPVIDFNWASNPPVPEIPADLISMIWAGRLRPKRSGEYIFYLTGDDGFRFWVDGKLVINGWKEHAATEYEARAVLEAGRDYEVKFSLAEVLGLVSLKWEWEGPDTPRQVVPQECLSPTGRYVKELMKWNFQEPGKKTYVNRSKMTNPGAHNGNYRLPVNGGEERWQRLGIGD